MITSQDNLITALASWQRWRADWNKITWAAAYTAWRWYDFSPLNWTPVANTWTWTPLNAQTPSETTWFGLYHWWNVTPDIKHILNMAAVTAVATWVPWRLMLVDMCLYYPWISMNSATAQTLVNGNTLTRNTNWAWLRAYLVTQATTWATAHNVALSYTNQAWTAWKTLPITVACTASAITPHITHSGTAANNYWPFLPLASWDSGIRSVQTITISAASGAWTAALVLAKPLIDIPLTTASVAVERDLLNQLPSLPKIDDWACLVWLYMAWAATAASTNFYWHIETVWD